MIGLEVKFKLNINGVREEIGDHGNVNTVTKTKCRSVWIEWRLLHFQKEESGCDKRDEDVSQKLMPAKNHFAFTAFLEILHEIVRKKDIMSEVKRSMTILQGIVKILVLYYKKLEASAWLGQLLKRLMLDFGSGHHLSIEGSSPHRAPGQAPRLALHWAWSLLEILAPFPLSSPCLSSEYIYTYIRMYIHTYVKS